jgi:hypothetical protein
MIDPRLYKLMRVPFAWCGRSLDGLDCMGLAVEARKILLPDLEPLPDPVKHYQRYKRHDIPPGYLFGEVSRNPRSNKVDEPAVGDLAVLRGVYGAALGTVVGDDSIIFYDATEYPAIRHESTLDVIGFWRVI